MPTIDDYSNWKKETEQKPPTAVGGGGSMPIFSPNGGQDILEGPSNRPLGEGATGAVDANGNVIDSNTQRVGDYVYSQGRAYLVPNSVTDLKLKGMVVSGGTKSPENVSNISWKNAIEGATSGALAGNAFGGPAGAAVGAVAGGILGNIYGSMTARRRAEKEWREQLVNYESAVDFYTDEDGKLKYHFDYSKMAKGGELSSPYVIQMQKEETEVGLSDDGRLKIKVSPIFASTEYYKSIVDDISKAYAGLTKNTDGVDEKIADIKKYIESAKNNYMANAISYAAYKASFPGASDTAIIAGYTTAFAGNANPEDMSEYMVYTIENGKIVEQTAEKFFDDFLAMNMDERNEFVKKLIQITTSGDIDEKVVAYGDLQALHAASANKYGYKDDKYQGMMDAEWLVTFWNQFQILDNMFLGDGRQEYLVQNEYAQNIGTLASAGARTFLTIKGLKTVQGVLPHVPGFKALYNASFLGEAGQAAGFFAVASNSLPQLIKAGAATILFNTSASAIFNAAVSGVRVATGDKPEEVWGEFGKNLVIDTAILTAMQFYDVVKFKATVTDTTQFVYKDAKTGNIKVLNTDINTSDGLVDVDIDGNPIADYTKVGEMNTAKTSQGTDIGYAKSGDTTLYRYGDKIYVVNNNGDAATWANASGESTPPKALSTGIIQEQGVAVTDSNLIQAAEAASLPTGTEIFELPSKDALSAVAAGKFTKIDGSKVGLKINEAAFNVNASLDYVNEKALAKTGDRTAWQTGNEAFSSIQTRADAFRKDIDTGKWNNSIVESKKASVRAFGDFTANFGKMTKDDQLYMKAKESIARAQIARDTALADSDIDPVAEAIAVNGKYLEGVSPERAAALDNYVATTKQYIKDYIISVKNSGLVDVEQINNVTNSDISREIGYIPMWGKKETYSTLLDQYYLVNQEKMPIKAWNREGGITDVKDIMDFVTSTNRLMDFFATNMATQFRNQVLAEQLESAGMLVDNKITTEQKRKELLKKVENFDELKDKFTELSNKAKRSVNRSVPSPEKYREQMSKIYTDSGIEKDIEALFSDTESVTKDVAKAQEDVRQFEADIQELEKSKKEYKNEIRELSGAGAKTDIAALSYDERRRLAEDVEHYNRGEKGGLGDYIPLYRVQGGKPDKWRPNDHGVKGKFEALGGEKGLKGAVWLTADRAWAEGPERATSGVKDATNENIVVIPVKRSDILPLMQETNAKSELDKSGKKIVQTRGIDGSLKKSEFILWENEHPEVFEEGMALMREQYVAGQAKYNQRAIRNREREISQIEDLIRDTKAKRDAALKIVKESVAKDKRPSSPKTVKKPEAPWKGKLTSESAREVGRYLYKNAKIKEIKDSGRVSSWLAANDIDDVEARDDASLLRLNSLPKRVKEYINNDKNLQRLIDRYGQSTAFWRLGADFPISEVLLNESYADALYYDEDLPDTDDDDYTPESKDIQFESVGNTPEVEIELSPADDVLANNSPEEISRNVVNRNTNQLFDNVVSKSEDIVRKAAKYNDKFGHTVDVDAYIDTMLKPMLNKGFSTSNKDLIRSTIANAELEVAPYVDRASVLKTRLDSVASEWRTWAEKNTKFAPGTEKDDMKYAIDVAAAEINGTTLDSYVMGAAQKAAGMGRTYPVTYFKNGRPYTRYIKANNDEERRIAESINHIINDKQMVTKRGVFNQAARSVANGFRLLTTGMDPSRVFPNLTRDTVRGEVSSGGVSFTAEGANNIFKGLLSAYDYTDEQKEMLSRAFDNMAEKVAGDTYNAAYGTPSKANKELQREYYRLKKSEAPNKLVKFAYDLKTLGYNLAHSPQKIFEAPGDFFEGYTRKRLAKSAFVNALREAQIQGKGFKDQYKAAEAAADFAGHEYTANFSRKGKVVGELSKYVAYFSTNFANFDGFKRAYINNPRGVSHSFATFLLAYLFILSDTLSNEKSRKNYYRLTDNDRSNSIVISMDDGVLLTVPMDETLSGMVFPFRRILETMNNVDPVSFYEFVWGTFTEPLPLDLSGFSEGDYFNFKRGMEKIISSAAPTWATGAWEATTGYDLYYGSSNNITAEDLKEQGIYDPQPGDYTTKSKNSATLREIANATGIPQWQLQILLQNYGGNVGQYVIGTIDKLSGASEEAQGGKDFFDAIFKSFVATDYNTANSNFYNTIQDLKADKNKLLQKLSTLNEKMKTASGDALYALQSEYQKAVDDYAIKVGDAVNQYLNAYEITGGLSKSQAMQVYYLFRLDDDDSVYMTGSVGEYFRGLAEQQSADEATRAGASVLDKYYDQSTRPYLDNSGTWRIAPSYGENAYYNTIYGQGTKYEVDLRNLLEKGDNSLKSIRSKAQEARSAAADAGDWDLYDQIGYEYDKKVIERIAPYIKKNGAESILTNKTALKYLEDWIEVPSDWMTNKKGKYVSLGHNAIKKKAYVWPYIKHLFGVDTGATTLYDEEKAKLTLRGQ